MTRAEDDTVWCEADGCRSQAIGWKILSGKLLAVCSHHASAPEVEAK